MQESSSIAPPRRKSQLRASFATVAGALGDLLLAPRLIAPFTLFIDDDRSPPR